jgi:GAF domain-containing protein
MSKRLGQFFNCRNGEVWELDRENNELRLFVPDLSKPLPVPIADGGIVGWSVQNSTVVSLVATQVHSAYNARADGKGESSLLVVPYVDDATGRVYAVALRHKRVPNFFSPADAQALGDLAPLIVASLNASKAVERSSQAHDDAVRSHKRMTTLLHIAHRLSSQLHFRQLIVLIVDFARKLVGAERGALFLLNETRDKFLTQLHLGLENAVEIPLATNVIGYTATTKQVLNMKNAYGDPRFDRGSDITRGYRTYTLLAAPIFAENGDVYGVIEVVNKEDGVFTPEDEQLLQLFNVFSRISIENARIYTASVDLYLRLGECRKGAVGKKAAEMILRDSRKVIDAARAILYVKAGDDIETFAVDEDLELKRQRTQEQITGKHNMKKSLIRKLMNGPDADLLTMTPEEIEQNRLVQQVFDAGKSEVSQRTICSPIIAGSHEVIGAILMQIKKNREEGFDQVDINLLEALCMFTVSLLEKRAAENPG